MMQYGKSIDNPKNPTCIIFNFISIKTFIPDLTIISKELNTIMLISIKDIAILVNNEKSWPFNR